MAEPGLSVVIPVYNEEGAIGAVLDEWTAVLDALRIDYEMRVYDDGSRDGSRAAIESRAASHARVVALHHANRGHGPTILRGYGESRGEWVFQTDSDGETPADAFPRLWELRADYDFIVGTRSGRHSPVPRRMLSGGARLAARLLFGARMRDVNSPYRLMRGAWLREQLPFLSTASAVPNVILSGLAARTKARIAEVPVVFAERRAGTSSLSLRRSARYAASALGEAVRVARRLRSR